MMITKKELLKTSVIAFIIILTTSINLRKKHESNSENLYKEDINERNLLEEEELHKRIIFEMQNHELKFDKLSNRFSNGTYINNNHTKIIPNKTEQNLSVNKPNEITTIKTHTIKNDGQIPVKEGTQISQTQTNKLHNKNEENFGVNTTIKVFVTKPENINIIKKDKNSVKKEIYNQNKNTVKEGNNNNSNDKPFKDLMEINNSHDIKPANQTIISQDIKKVKKTELSNIIEKESPHNETYNNNTEESEVYYIPQVGGIKINNPLPNEAMVGCKNCPPQEPSDKITVKLPENNKWVNLEKVKYVKELSPASKAAMELENIQDPEYKKLLLKGYESPKFINKIVREFQTPVAKPSNVNYNWAPSNSRDAGLWQNVEYNRYNNQLLDVSRWNTPAHFTMSEDGRQIAHAPSGSGMQIISPASTTVSSFDENPSFDLFLETDNKEYTVKNYGEIFA